MRRLLEIFFLLLSCTLGYGQARSVMVNPDGTLRAPTNLFVINSNLLNQVISGSSEATYLLHGTTNADLPNALKLGAGTGIVLTTNGLTLEISANTNASAVIVRTNGVGVGTNDTVNFIPGTGITLNGTNNSGVTDLEIKLQSSLTNMTIWGLSYGLSGLNGDRAIQLGESYIACSSATNAQAILPDPTACQGKRYVVTDDVGGGRVVITNSAGAFLVFPMGTGLDTSYTYAGTEPQVGVWVSDGTYWVLESMNQGSSIVFDSTQFTTNGSTIALKSGVLTTNVSLYGDTNLLAGYLWFEQAGGAGLRLYCVDDLVIFETQDDGTDVMAIGQTGLYVYKNLHAISNLYVYGAIITNGLQLADVTNDRVLIKAGNRVTNSASVSPSELEYLAGVTSGIQAQLDARVSEMSGVATNLSMRGSNSIAASSALYFDATPNPYIYITNDAGAPIWVRTSDNGAVFAIDPEWAGPNVPFYMGLLTPSMVAIIDENNYLTNSTFSSTNLTTDLAGWSQLGTNVLTGKVSTSDTNQFLTTNKVGGAAFSAVADFQPADSDLTNWATISTNLMIATNLFTAEGDILIFSNGAPARLAIGSPSQVLKVTSGFPAWGTDATGGGGSDFDSTQFFTNASTQIAVKSGAYMTNITLQGNTMFSNLTAGSMLYLQSDKSITNAPTELSIDSETLRARATYLLYGATNAALTNGFKLTASTGITLATNGLNLEISASGGAAGGAVVTNSIPVTLSCADTNVYFDAGTYNFFSLTLTNNSILWSPTNPPAQGQKIIIALTQDATGNRYPVLTNGNGTGWKYGTDFTEPFVASTNAGAIDLLTAVYFGTNWLLGGLRGY